MSIGGGKRHKHDIALLIFVMAVAASIIVYCVFLNTQFSTAIHFSGMYAMWVVFHNNVPFLYGDPNILADLFDTAVGFLLLLSIAGLGSGALLLPAINKAVRWVQKRTEKHEEIILVILLLTIATTTRIMLLNDGIFHHDSIGLAGTVKQVESEHKLYGVISGRYGFVLANSAYYYGLKHLIGIEDYDLILNLITALFGSLSVIFVYLIARQFLATRKSAFFASILFLSMPVVWSVGTFAKEHGVSLFFSLFGVWGFFYGGKKRSQALLIIGGIALGYSMLVRVTNALILIPLIFWVLFHQAISQEAGSQEKNARNARPWKQYGIFFIPIIATILWLVLFQWGDISYESGYNQIRWEDPGFVTQRLATSLLFSMRSITLIGMLVLVGGMIALLVAKKKTMCAFLLLWILPTFLYIGATPYPSPRHFEVMFLPCVLLMMHGIGSISKKSQFHGKIIYGVILLLMIISIFPILQFRHAYSAPKHYVQYINRIAPTNSGIISLDDHVFITYYSNKTVYTIPYKENSDSIRAALTRIRDALRNGTHIYISEKVLYWVGQNIISPNLQANFDLQPVGEVVAEDYHNAEILLLLHRDRVHEVKLKGNQTNDNIKVYTYIR